MSAADANGTRFTAAKTVVITLDKGTDLLEEIERLVVANDLAFCRLSGLGSLVAARMTYYDQTAHEDLDIIFEQPMMLVSLTGTVFHSDGQTEAHVHLVLADEYGASYGGDLSSGCVVFSCELILMELVGPAVSRQADEATGLSHLSFGAPA